MMHAPIDPARLAPASAGASGCGTVRFDGGSKDAALTRAWQRLEAHASLPTQCLAFSAALAGTLLAGAEIGIFQACQGETIQALLPMCRTGGVFSRWRMVGAQEVFEPCDALYASPQAAAGLAEAILRDGRPVTLDRLPAGSPLIAALEAGMQGRGRIRISADLASPTIALDDGWKEPESRFNSGRRSDFRRAARRAGELGTVTYEVLAPAPHRFDALFDEAIRVEASSWKQDAGTAMAADRDKERFFRDYFRAMCERGQFRVAFMRIDGRAVAMQLAVESCERYWLFKIGFDESHSKCSPGTLLMLHTLGYAAARGLRAYELLGNIEPWIAEFWTRDAHECVRLRIYPYNVRGLVAFASDGAVWLYRRLRRGTG